MTGTSQFSDMAIWAIILTLGVGTYLIRWSFLGVIGSRPMPAWAMRLLRYTAVAVLPALSAPLVVWPNATGGEPDPARLAAAAVTLAAGLLTRSVLAAIVAGLATLYGMIYLLA